MPLAGLVYLGPSPRGGLLNLYTFRGLVLLVLVVKIASGETVCDHDSSLLIFVVCGETVCDHDSSVLICMLHHNESS